MVKKHSKKLKKEQSILKFIFLIVAVIFVLTASVSSAITTVPDSPTSLSGTAVGSQVTLNWLTPSNDGGAAISDYLVEFQPSGGDWQTFSDGISTNLSAVITGLTNSNSYSFRVSAINSSGTGTASSIHTVSLCTNLGQFNNLAGLILWLRADCVNGTPTSPSNNSSVSTWEDLSGNNNDASTLSGQSSPTFQNGATYLINNLPVLNFTRTNNGTGTVMKVDNIDIRANTLPDVSIFVVYKPRRSSDNGETLGVWGNDDGGWDRFFLARYTGFGNDGLISLGPGSSTLSTARVTNSGVDLTTRLMTAIYDGTVTSGTNSGPTDASKVYFGSTLITSFTDSTNATAAKEDLFIGWDGDDSAFRGDIAEFIVFNRALSSDLPSINEYLNSRYNLDLDISTNLPDVILVDPRATSVNFPRLTLSQSSNAMICFRQVSNSSGADISGSPTLAISRSNSVSGVVENSSSNLWRYNGIRADVQTQIESIQVSGTLGNPLVTSGSKWLEVHVTSRTSGASDCTSNIQVRKRIELRALGLDATQKLTIDVN